MTEQSGKQQVERQVEQFRTDIAKLRDEIGRVIVGQESVVDGVITSMIAGGHALLEGVPGLGKTMLVRTMARALSLQFSRIQFTPDLMPADIIGTTVIDESSTGQRAFEFRPGPIFGNIILADEINRATPKTQSALLEAMQERTVTVAKTTHRLERPFFVLATQNPLEMEGTYPLPEAQLDRFFLKLHVTFPNRKQMHSILNRTTGDIKTEVSPVLDKERILAMQHLALSVPAAEHVQDYAIRVLQACHPDSEEATDIVKRYVRFGPSPRGAQATLLAAKIRALFEGRYAAAIEDIKHVAMPALRHRVLLNFEGEAEGITADQVLDQVLEHLPDTL